MEFAVITDSRIDRCCAMCGEGDASHGQQGPQKARVSAKQGIVSIHKGKCKAGIIADIMLVAVGIVDRQYGSVHPQTVHISFVLKLMTSSVFLLH